MREVLIGLVSVGLLLFYVYAVQNRFWKKFETEQKAEDTSGVVPPANQIALLMTHYGFDLEGAKVMWGWIRSGNADVDSLALDLFLQKIQGESLEGEVEGMKLSPEKLICSPQFKEELPEIKSFLHEVRFAAG